MEIPFGDKSTSDFYYEFTKTTQITAFNIKKQGNTQNTTGNSNKLFKKQQKNNKFENIYPILSNKKIICEKSNRILYNKNYYLQDLQKEQNTYQQINHLIIYFNLRKIKIN